MKKKFLMIVAFFAMTLGVSAQPTPNGTPTSPANDPTGNGGDGLRRAPIAPATLLLLGLGGAAVGTMVYRNTKNKKEE